MRYYQDLIQQFAFHAPYMCGASLLRGRPAMILLIGGKENLIVPYMEEAPFISRIDQAILLTALEYCCTWNDIEVIQSFHPAPLPKSWHITLKKGDAKVEQHDQDKHLAMLKAFTTMAVVLELKPQDCNPGQSENFSIPPG